MTGTDEAEGIKHKAACLRRHLRMHSARMTDLHKIINPRAKQARTMSTARRADIAEEVLAEMTLDLHRLLQCAAEIRGHVVDFIEEARAEDRQTDQAQR